MNDRETMITRLTRINPMGAPRYRDLTDAQLRQTLARHDRSPHTKAQLRGKSR